jgi:hypothetical protein
MGRVRLKHRADELVVSKQLKYRSILETKKSNYYYISTSIKNNKYKTNQKMSIFIVNIFDIYTIASRQ